MGCGVIGASLRARRDGYKVRRASSGLRGNCGMFDGACVGVSIYILYLNTFIRPSHGAGLAGTCHIIHLLGIYNVNGGM